MKDQHQVLHKCLVEDVPAFVLQTAIEKGCSDEFVNDMVLVLREFERFQHEEPKKVKIPD